MKWDPQFTGTSRFVSPVINLTGITNLKLEFNHMLDHYSGAYSVGVATRSGGGSWNIVWEVVNPTGNINATTVNISISNANVGASDFQICWYFNGNSYNIDYWYIDNIKLFTPLPHDALVNNILTEPEYAPGTNLSPQAVVKNFGLNPETFDATCTIKLNGNTLYTQTCSQVSLAAGAEQTVTFPGYDLSVPNDIYEISVKTNLSGDMDPSNDLLSKTFDTYTTPREMVILEIGTGTWCQYCPGASMGAHDLIANGKTVGVVKYHNGDSFTNTCSNARNTYYGISGFPTAVFDGVEYFVGGSNTQSMYSNYLPMYNGRKEKNSAFSVDIHGENTGLDYTLQIRVVKLAVTPPNTDNLILHLALTESNIPYSWQGQTEVNFAERLMAPNENGTVLNFNSGNEQIINLSFSLNSTWVIENCEIVSFIQNPNDKEILQGTKVTLTNLTPLPVELSSFTATVEKNGVILKWSTASEVNNHGFEIEKSSDAENFHTIGFVSGAGTTTDKQNYTFIDKLNFTPENVLYYRLKQVDLNGKYNYSSVISVDNNLPLEFALLQNYPNPFNPSTTITYSVANTTPVNLKLYDISGQEVATLVNEVKNPGIYKINFDAASLASGVYLVRMIAGNYSSVVKMNILK